MEYLVTYWWCWGMMLLFPVLIYDDMLGSHLCWLMHENICCYATKNPYAFNEHGLRIFLLRQRESWTWWGQEDEVYRRYPWKILCCWCYILGQGLMILKLHCLSFQIDDENVQDFFSCCYWQMFMVQILYGVWWLSMNIMILLRSLFLVINSISIS